MFENCTDLIGVLDLDGDLPADLQSIPPKRTHAVGTPVNFYYLGGQTSKAVKAEEGCTYSRDTYINWQPVAKGEAVAPEADGRLLWKATHTFQDSDVKSYMGQTAFFHMTRYQECGGEKKKIDTVCNQPMF